MAREVVERVVGKDRAHVVERQPADLFINTSYVVRDEETGKAEGSFRSRADALARAQEMAKKR
jgi:hypothetical protein